MDNNFRIAEKCCGTCDNRDDEALYGSNPSCPSAGSAHICKLTGKSVGMSSVCDSWFGSLLAEPVKPLTENEKIIEFLNSEEGHKIIREIIAEGTPFSDKIKEARTIDLDVLRKPLMAEKTVKKKCRHIVAIGYVVDLLLKLHEDEVKKIIEEYRDAEICWLKFCPECGAPLEATLPSPEASHKRYNNSIERECDSELEHAAWDAALGKSYQATILIRRKK